MKGGGLVSWFKTKLGMVESAFRSTFPRENTQAYLGIEYCFRSELKDDGKRNALTNGNTTTAAQALTWLHGDIKKFYDAGVLAYVCNMGNTTGNYSIHYKLGKDDKTMENITALNAGAVNALTKVKIFVKFPAKPFNDFITEILNQNSTDNSPKYKCIDMNTYKEHILPKIKEHVNKPSQTVDACPVIPGIASLFNKNRKEISPGAQAVKFAYDRKMLSIVVGYGPHETIKWQGVAILLFNLLGATLNIIDTLSGRRLGLRDLTCPRHGQTGITPEPITETSDKLTVIAKNKYGFNAKYRGSLDNNKITTGSSEAERVFSLPTIYLIDNSATKTHTTGSSQPHTQQLSTGPSQPHTQQLSTGPSQPIQNQEQLATCETHIANRLKMGSSFTGFSISFEVPKNLAVKILTPSDIPNIISSIIPSIMNRQIGNHCIIVSLPFNNMTNWYDTKYALQVLNTHAHNNKIANILANLNSEPCKLITPNSLSTKYGLLFRVLYNHNIRETVYLATINSNMITDTKSIKCDIEQVTAVTNLEDLDYLIHVVPKYQ
jgi:hypothetical protein